VFLAKPKAFKQMKSEVQELCRERDLSLEYRSRCTESTESMDNQMSALVLLRKSADESVTTFDHLDDDSILNVFAHLDTLIERTVVESGSYLSYWHQMATNFVFYSLLQFLSL
jgi:hypothetical protein